MPRDFKNYLTSKLGESLVVAELARRGIVATAFSGSVPDIDILAYKDGATLPLQVKTWRGGGVQFNASRFLEISQQGNRQSVIAERELKGTLTYVFVRVAEDTRSDRYFVLDQLQLRSIVHDNYQGFLDKHDGVRPRNPQTTHVAVYEPDLLSYEDRWDGILSAMSVSLS
ncbi:MAG: hypothetical protein FJ035_00675 [Chloroflexi bacterium]|nr:hypothetical protein [Chloroflexota bacterium]